MEEENESEKEFPGLYAPESYKSDSDCNENSHEKGGKKDLLKSRKKEKNKDKGYAALDAESSGEEMEYLDLKNPLKPKRPKSFKFLQKKDKEEKEKEEKKDEKRKRDEKDDKRRDKKKEKEERRIREKEEKKKIKKEKKKKECSEGYFEESYPIFGVPLSIAVDRNPSHDGVRLPALVRECIDFVEEKGLNTEGIYRLGGVKTKVQELRRAYNAGEAPQLTDQHPNVVASLLKNFLRELPETVLTVDMMPHFEDVCLIPNPRERAEAMRQLIHRLPTTNKLLLQYVLKHMGHVIQKEKETKMSAHSVCVVLSPTMQISHRVLNVMFHSHSYLFGNVHIKRYIPPITSYSGAKRSIEDLRSLSEIAEEICKQESLLCCLHSAIAAGRISQKTEEQLWEAQRILTLLKRKLKSVERKKESRVESFQEPSSEESQKEGPPSPGVKLFPSEKMTGELENEEEKNSASHGEMKWSNDTETGASSPSTKTPPSDEGKKSYGEESQRNIVRRGSCLTAQEEEKDVQHEEAVKKHGSDVKNKEVCKEEREEERVGRKVETSDGDETKEKQIPILPKPTISSRTERRHKVSQSGREKGDISSQRRSKDENLTADHQIEFKCTDVPYSDSRRILCDKDPRRLNSAQRNLNGKDVPQNDRDLQTSKPGPEMNGKLKAAECVALTEESDFSSLVEEETRLSLEHEELLSVNQELTRKLQAEKTQISRLRDEIQEMQTLYGYRTHSYDSSESEGSDSEVDSDNEEEETRKQVVVVEKHNNQIQLDNAALIQWIQTEREALIRLRVAFRLNEMKLKASNLPTYQRC